MSIIDSVVSLYSNFEDLVSLILSSSSQQAAGRTDESVAASDWGSLTDEEKKEAEDLLAKCYGYSYGSTGGNYYLANPYSSAYTTYPSGNLYSGYPINVGYPVNAGYTFG